MQYYLYVFLGGMTGAILRYLVQLLVVNYLMLWVVNVIGSFLLGCLNGVFKRKFHEGWKLFLTTGMLGAFTTFSTFSESWFLLIDENIILGLIYGLGMTYFCFIAALVGYRLVEGER